MTKVIPTEQTPENIADVLVLLGEMPDRLQVISKQFTQEQLTTPVGPGERTPTGILAHLIHCEAVSSEAVTLALLRKEPLLPGLHPERDFGKLFNLGKHDFDDLRMYFNFRRRILLDVLTGLTEKQWSRTVQEAGKQRRESVYWLVRGLALHEDGHVGEIEGLVSG